MSQHLKDTPSEQARGNTHGTLAFGSSTKDFHTACRAVTPYHTTTAEVALQSFTGRYGTSDRSKIAHGMEELIYKHSDTHVQLPRSMLTRIRIDRPDSEPITALCACEEMGYLGMKLILPCKIGLAQGNVVYMELFLNPEQGPTTVHGKVKKISILGSEDAIRYSVDLDFCGVTSSAEREIAAFVRASQAAQKCPVLTQ